MKYKKIQEICNKILKEKNINYKISLIEKNNISINYDKGQLNKNSVILESLGLELINNKKEIINLYFDGIDLLEIEIELKKINDIYFSFSDKNNVLIENDKFIIGDKKTKILDLSKLEEKYTTHFNDIEKFLEENTKKYTYNIENFGLEVIFIKKYFFNNVTQNEGFYYSTPKYTQELSFLLSNGKNKTNISNFSINDNIINNKDFINKLKIKLKIGKKELTPKNINTKIQGKVLFNNNILVQLLNIILFHLNIKTISEKESLIIGKQGENKIKLSNLLNINIKDRDGTVFDLEIDRFGQKTKNIDLNIIENGDIKNIIINNINELEKYNYNKNNFIDNINIITFLSNNNKIDKNKDIEYEIFELHGFHNINYDNGDINLNASGLCYNNGESFYNNNLILNINIINLFQQIEKIGGKIEDYYNYKIPQIIFNV